MRDYLAYRKMSSSGFIAIGCVTAMLMLSGCLKEEASVKFRSSVLTSGQTPTPTPTPSPSPGPGTPTPSPTPLPVTGGKAYYISPTGNNSTGLGTYASPWASPAFAYAKMKSGDTLVLKNGT